MTVLRALVLVVLLAGAATADVTVQARLDAPEVGVGETTALGIEIDGAQNVAVPEVPAVDGLTLHYVGPSTQVSIVNGQMSQSVTHRFSVTATRPGRFTIGPVAVVVDGRRYDAAAVQLNAVPAGAARPAEPRAGGDQLRLVLSATKSEVYLHERIPIRLELWVGNVRVSDLQYPTLAGDGVAIEKLPDHPAQRREGAFQVLTFASALTPLRTGTLTVGPASMGLNVLVRSRTRDPFFGFFGESQQAVPLHSEPLTLTVLPLPDEGRPPDFTAGVGRFEMDVRAAPLEVAVGDPVTVTTTIQGDGDLSNVAPPAIPASDALRVYPVQAAAPSGMQRTFDQVVIPLRAGAIALPEQRLSYFDPDARAYRTITHPSIALTVHPGAQSAGPQIVGTATPRAPAERLGRDLVFIKDDPGPLVSTAARRARSVVFWTWQVVPLALWLGAAAWDRRRRRLTGDLRYARFTRAGRAARQALAGARTRLGAGDGSAFYDTVARAMTEYLAAKLDLPPGGVTVEAVNERLGRNGVAAGVARDLERLFASCEHARFAPTADGSGDMERTLERAIAIVRALERERRLGRAVAAAGLVLALAAHGAIAATPDSPNAIFFHANALYGEEHYAEAAAEYERIVAAGVASGNVHFNLGNAYFKAGDVGRAILEYERARRRMPADPDLLANLAYARTIAGASDEPAAWSRLVFPLAERFATDRLLLGASALYTLLTLSLTAARLWPGSARGARIGAAMAAVGLVAVVPSLAFRLATIDLRTAAVVVAKDDATVRFEPSATGTEHFRAKPGTLLRVDAERAGWAQVVRADGLRGWVEQDAIATVTD